MSLKNKVVLVTGASRGIGKAVAAHLTKAGSIVVGVDYNSDESDSKCFFMDVTKQESIEKTMEQINKEYGAPSILVNNAGITRDNLMLRMSQEEWDQVISTNLTSSFRLCRICIRDMVKARFGRIINIASVVAYSGNAGQANYAASKGGIVSFSKSLAIEVASRNITVNCIAPGFIETDMTKKLTPEQRETLLLKVPAKRLGQPEDIANAVAFLASEESSYITGATIHVNGGMYMF
ncbi:MAG: 3-oxoacyl-ACP reductase FabG [bacterium]